MIKIILVEDVPGDAKIVEKWLSSKLKKEHDIYIVSNKEDFEDAIENIRCDIVLTDYNIQIDFSGLDVIKYIKQKNLLIPIIIVSGAIGEDKAAELMLEGASDFILKERLDRLVPAIEREMDDYYYKLDQIEISNMVNKLLFQLAITTKWIMQNSVHDISFYTLLKDFGSILGVDRAFIYQREENDVFVRKYEWDRNFEEHETCSLGYHTLDTKFSLVNNILEGTTIADQVKNLPDHDREHLIFSNILSIACVPVLNPSKNIWGFFGFEDLSKERSWTNLEKNALEAIGAIIGVVVDKLERSSTFLTEIQAPILTLKNIQERTSWKLTEKRKRN